MNFVRVVCPVLILVFCLFSFAFAEEEETPTFFDSNLEFTEPESLLPDTEYQFEISVYNATPYQEGVRGEWIYAVDLTMPSADYQVNTDSIDNPDPLNPCAKSDVLCTDRWESAFDPTTMTITWEAFPAMSGWAPVGDIREEEILAFAFTATTDADASDGFAWVLHGDDGDDVEGISYLDDGSGQDDDTPGEDDDTPVPDDDDDAVRDEEDDGGGCSC